MFHLLHQKTWFRAGVAALIIIGIIITVTPLGIRYAILDWLKNNGAPQSTLEDIDFNPFTGRLVIKQLHIPDPGGTALRLGKASFNLEWTGLLRKRLYLSEVALSDAQITIERNADHIKVGGIDLSQDTASDNGKEKENKPFTWGLGLDVLALDNVKIRYHDPQIDNNLEIDTLRISKLYSWQRTLPANVRLKARLSGGALDIHGDTTPFDTKPSITMNINVHDIDLSFLDAIAKVQGIDDLQGLAGVDLQLMAQQNAPDTITLKTQGKLSLDKFHLQTQGYAIDNDKFRWNGNTMTKLASGKLDFQTRGESTINDLRVVDARKSMQLAAIDAISLSGISVEGLDNITTSHVQVDNASLIRPLAVSGGERKEGDHPVITIQQTRINNVQINNLKSIDVDKVKLSGLAAELIRDKQGALPQISALHQPEPTTGTTTTPAKPNNPQDKTMPLKIRLGEFEVLDNSQILFKDASVKPAFNLEVKPLRLHLTNLDSSKPEQDTAISLDATINKRATLKLSGNIQPFLERPAADIKLSIKDTELPPLSAYSQRYIGYNILSGRLNIDTKLAIKDNRVKADNRLLARNFKLTAVDNSKKDEISAKLSMPLDTALDLLRDDHDNIKLTVPISGDLDNPDVGISDAINQALVKATKNATMTYLKYALQPWGGILLASEFVAGQITAVRFEPVPFAPGSDTLNDDAQSYLKKVSELLAKRPQLQLTLCGKAVLQDKQALMEDSQKVPEDSKEKPQVTPEQMQTLAEHRGMAVKKRLTSLGVNPERLFQCQPKVITDKSATPGVDLML